jgi:hypothetical protein
VILLAAGSVPMGRAVVSHFHTPAAPAPITSFTAPKAPEDLQSYPAAEIALPVSADAGYAKSFVPPKRIRPVLRSQNRTHSYREAARAVTPAARDTRSDVAVPALTLPSVAAPLPAALQRAALRIKINATVGEGTLAIFADHELLLTTGLREYAAADPARLERLLTAGPHQLRVALYRADKSLQTEKEGLGELRADSENTLTIRVSKRPKMLVRRETALEVIWPSAIAPQTHGTPSPSIATATALK